MQQIQLVRKDTNNDDAPEAPIATVTIELYEDTNGDGQPDGAPIATTTTDANGDYVFPNLPAGDYVVVEVQPPGYVDVTEGDNTPDATDGTGPMDMPMDNSLPVTLGPGETDDSNDFVEEIPGAISGNVGEDTNGDGAPEAPIATVTHNRC